MFLSQLLLLALATQPTTATDDDAPIRSFCSLGSRTWRVRR